MGLWQDKAIYRLQYNMYIVQYKFEQRTYASVEKLQKT